MIKISFDDSLDLKSAIPAGARVGILGCASCASVFRAGDTEKIEETVALLEGHCDVVVATSIDSPCDQRVARYLATTVSRFDEVEVFVVLACEAGSRSLGALLAKRGVTLVTPTKTTGFCVIGTDGKTRRACLFCDECRFPDRSRLCPVATCPVGKADGPCQRRTSERCVVDEEMSCVWLP